MDERRRYFRIDDNIGIRYEVLAPDEVAPRQAALARGEIRGDNTLQLAERQLQLLIDKLRVQQPEFAEAIHLLNTKFNALKDALPSHADFHSVVMPVSISACGLSFDIEAEIRAGEILYMDLTLLPTDLHIHTLAEIVACQQSGSVWTISADYLNLSEENEELMVQHIVKRQRKILAERREQD
tara:strand:- start:8311 stop:8859 length:549 start_codon:yes stop_codon:yes gene_type:complete